MKLLQILRLTLFWLMLDSNFCPCKMHAWVGEGVAKKKIKKIYKIKCRLEKSRYFHLLPCDFIASIIIQMVFSELPISKSKEIHTCVVLA